MKRAPAVIVTLLLFAALGSAVQKDQFRIEVAVDLVNVNFSAMDSKGRMIPGLVASDFTVEEDGKVQTISLFAREHELPLTLAMLVDISPSVAPILDEEKWTASAFLKSLLGPRDLALLISFDEHVTLLQDFTEDLRSLQNAVETLNTQNPGTSLYDAVYLAAEEKLARETGRKAIVIMSDGNDSTSKFNISKAMIAAHKSDAVIYAISNAGNSGTLSKMAEETGGAFFRMRREGDFREIFEQIALELRTQYSIAYHSTNPARDGAFRRIKIIPRDSKITVRARRGYYADSNTTAR
jgi:VWFA-related protein